MKARVVGVGLGVILTLGGQPVAMSAEPALQRGPSSSVAGAAVAAQAQVRTLRPRRLDRGRNARIPTLQDGRLRPGDGSGVMRVDLPHRGERVHLLGRSGRGWLVAAEGAQRSAVYRLRRGRAPVVVPHTRWRARSDQQVHWYLSRQGDHLVKTRDSGMWSRRVVLEAVSGTVVAHATTYDEWQLPLDVDAGRVLARLAVWDDTWQENVVRVYDWTLGEAPRIVARHANAGFIDQDVLFARVGFTDEYGPTSLTTPGEPVWSAPFAAIDLSPDGTLALGTRSTAEDRTVLELRRMVDGEVVDAIGLGPSDRSNMFDAAVATARFESNRAVLFEMTRKSGSVLVRCTVSGRCTRASGWGGDVTVPHERYRDPLG